MRTSLTYFLKASLVASLLGLALFACSKDDEFFAGENRIQGIVLFENGITGTLDTAYNAQLRVYPNGDSSQVLNYTLTNGRFDVSNLEAGKNYTLAVRLDYRLSANQPYVAYQSWRKMVSVTNSPDTLRVVLRPSIIKQTGLRLTVTNPTGYFISKAQVYLFADSTTGKRNARTGAGSIANAVTNPQGQAIFLNLQPKIYYVSAFSVSGKDTISNSLPRQIGAKTVVTATPTIASYTVFLQYPPVIVPTPAAPSLRLIVMDSTGRILLPDSKVCLYTTTSQLTRRGTDCLNGLLTGTTTPNGEVIFSNLQATSYRALAVKVLGRDTLTNLRTSTLLGPLPTQGERRDTIKLMR